VRISPTNGSRSDPTSQCPPWHRCSSQKQNAKDSYGMPEDTPNAKIATPTKKSSRRFLLIQRKDPTNGIVSALLAWH